MAILQLVLLHTEMHTHVPRSGVRVMIVADEGIVDAKLANLVRLFKLSYVMVNKISLLQQRQTDHSPCSPLPPMHYIS